MASDRAAIPVKVGDQATQTAARETPLWQAWIQERFPMPAGLIDANA